MSGAMAGARQREGLPNRTELLYGATLPETIEIMENNLVFGVDIASVRKPAFSWISVTAATVSAGSASGAMVLNCFSYTGGFFRLLCPWPGKTSHFRRNIGTCECNARRNLDRNGFSVQDHPVIQADVFHYLRETKELFDLIILDRPSFAKSRKDVIRASRGYKDINLQAIRHLERRWHSGHVFLFKLHG